MYEHISDQTYRVTIITYTKCSSISADRDSLELVWYDIGGLEIGNRVVPRSSKTSLPDDVCRNDYSTIVSFPGRSTYIITMGDPNRIGGIVNIPGSIGVPFYLEDTIRIQNRLTVGENNSVILFTPPIDYACTGDTFVHNPGAYDPDGDSLVYVLVPPKQALGLSVSGYSYPNEVSPGPFNNLTLDRETGELVWAVPQMEGVYNLAILIREYRNGILLSSIIRDMQVFVDRCNNDPPKIKNLIDTCIEAGSTLNIRVEASDPDFGQTVSLEAYGGPLEIATSPADFFPGPTGNPTFGDFQWNTTCDHVRSQFYSVIFRAEDNGPTPLVDMETYIITVVAPAPTGLAVTTTGNVADLTWDNPYECFSSPKFRGFTVWRKIGCDSNDISPCDNDLGSMGYTALATDLMVYTYSDNTLSPGNQYTYRVTANFAETTDAGFDYDEFVGAPSAPVCVELSLDVPILTHITVDTTDLGVGEMTIAWIKADPIELDTVTNEAPYRYELINNTNSSTVASIIHTTFSQGSATLGDSMSVVNQLLNTEETQFDYTLNFYATLGGTETLMGSSPLSSSIFLTTVGKDNQVQLTWTESVPWLNDSYTVYRELPPASGTFVAIGTTTEQNYIDDSLSNGTEYCYYIESFGAYSSLGAPDSLINLSQISCDIPIDSFEPCPPILSVSNICDLESDDAIGLEDLINYLTWTNPNFDCEAAMDVVAYNVYTSASASGNFELLNPTPIAVDTFFDHEDLESLAGCYAVTAIDSFGNESELSNIVCVDNCPQYELPNVFTPNGDGQNDLFTPFLPYLFIDRIDIKIFNRWGDLVFESQDPFIGWDGTNLQGEELAESVYYYVCDVFEIRVSGVVQSPRVLNGYVHLMRGKSN